MLEGETNNMNNFNVKITVLCENTVGLSQGLIGEWGLSLLVETPDIRILFDTGAQGHILNNANALNIDLKTVDALVLSHGHYDHTGGMQAFLHLRGQLPVFVHSTFFAPHYKSSSPPKYIGVQFTKEELEKSGANFIITDKPKEIAPRVWVSGEIPQKKDKKIVSNNFFSLDHNGKKVSPDPLKDDMSLFCVTPKGLLIILGCAHAGLINIIQHAREVTGVKPIYGIIGGTHLEPTPVPEQEDTIKFLQSLNLQFLAPNHCTGLSMLTRLANCFDSCFHFAPTGSRFTLPID